MNLMRLSSSDEENEDGFQDVTGPDYILDSLPFTEGEVSVLI